MKKYLFAAAMLPVAFASCTQDAFEQEMVPGNTPNAKGFNLEIVAQMGDTDATRTFSPIDKKLHFETGEEKINMFWLDASKPSGNYFQKFNSIFNIEKEGEGDDAVNVFKSQSMVYLGYNVATYPGQTETVEEGEISLGVKNNKISDLGNMPFISNLIKFETSTVNGGGNLMAGFNNKLTLPMKQAANYADVDLQFEKIATEVAYCDGLVLEEVEFNTNNEAVKVFAENAQIQTVDGGKVTTNGYFKVNKNPYTPIVEETKAVATGVEGKLNSYAFSIEPNQNAVSQTSGKLYAMTFPTHEAAEEPVVENVNTPAAITVRTNMGYVVIKTTKDAASKSTTPLYRDNVSQTVEDFFNALTAYAKGTGTTFKGEYVGARAGRTLKVDMSQAILTGSKVKNSNDILRYISLYDKLKKDDEMVLVLDPKFEGINKEAKKALDAHAKVTLDCTDCKAIILLEGGDVKAATPAGTKFTNTDNALTFILNQNDAWTVEENMSIALNGNTYKFVNKGALTLKLGNERATFGYELTNYGTVQMDCADFNMGTYTNNGTTTVDVNKTLNLMGTTVNNKKIVVKERAQLLVADATTEFQNAANGVVENSGFMAVQLGSSSTGSITNTGIINVAHANATTLITKNGTDSKKGTINLMTRDDEVSVGDADFQGYIAIKTSKLGSNGVYKATTGDKMNKLEVDEASFTVNGNNNDEMSKNAILYITIEQNASVFGTFQLYELVVAKNKTMSINTGNKVEVHSLAQYSTVINSGAKIVVGGTLFYGTCEQITQIYTTGASATVRAEE